MIHLYNLCNIQSNNILHLVRLLDTSHIQQVFIQAIDKKDIPLINQLITNYINKENILNSHCMDYIHNNIFEFPEDLLEKSIIPILVSKNYQFDLVFMAKYVDNKRIIKLILGNKLTPENFDIKILYDLIENERDNIMVLKFLKLANQFCQLKTLLDTGLIFSLGYYVDSETHSVNVEIYLPIFEYIFETKLYNANYFSKSHLCNFVDNLWKIIKSIASNQLKEVLEISKFNDLLNFLLNKKFIKPEDVRCFNKWKQITSEKSIEELEKQATVVLSKNNIKLPSLDSILKRRKISSKNNDIDEIDGISISASSEPRDSISSTVELNDNPTLCNTIGCDENVTTQYSGLCKKHILNRQMSKRCILWSCTKKIDLRTRQEEYCITHKYNSLGKKRKFETKDRKREYNSKKCVIISCNDKQQIKGYCSKHITLGIKNEKHICLTPLCLKKRKSIFDDHCTIHDNRSSN